MIDLIRLLMFLTFVAGCGAIAFSRTFEQRKARVQLLAAYLLVVHAALVITGRDAWPFTTYPLIQKTSRGTTVYQKYTFFGVDAAGREWPVDPDSFSPVAPAVMMQWSLGVRPRLSPDAQDRAGQFLLARAESRRRRMLAGEVSPDGRFLGPLYASDWWVYTRPEAVSPTPFAGLRLYREEFRPRDRFAGRGDVGRSLVLEVRR
jgi:hypothetical protein